MISHEYLNIYEWTDIVHAAKYLSQKIYADFTPDMVVGIPRGGMIFATLLAEMLRKDLYTIYSSRRINDEQCFYDPVFKAQSVPDGLENKKILIVDEIAVTGKALAATSEYLRNNGAKSVKTCVIVNRSCGQFSSDYTFAFCSDNANVFPWDYVVLSPNNEFMVHPEYSEMDETLGVDLYDE